MPLSRTTRRSAHEPHGGIGRRRPLAGLDSQVIRIRGCRPRTARIVRWIPVQEVVINGGRSTGEYAGTHVFTATYGKWETHVAVTPFAVVRTAPSAPSRSSRWPGPASRPSATGSWPGPVETHWPRSAGSRVFLPSPGQCSACSNRSAVAGAAGGKCRTRGATSNAVSSPHRPSAGLRREHRRRARDPHGGLARQGGDRRRRAPAHPTGAN